jgi:cation-transporting ATPase E
MQDILKLFLTRVLVVALLILSIGVVGGFPFTPKQSSLLALFTVGIPTVVLAAWARPGGLRQRNLARSLLHFVLPASFTLALAALGVYLAYFVPAYRAIRAISPAATEITALGEVLPVAQSALTTVTVLCGLLLIPFVEPPTRAWVGGDVLSGDPRPFLLTLVLLAAYAVVLAIPQAREFLELAPLDTGDYVLIGIVVVLWALVLRWTWRARLLDRFLGEDFGFPGQEP